MTLEDLRGKKIGIIGFGIEGQAMARFFAAHGVPFSIMNANEEFLENAEAAALSKHALSVRTGTDYLGNLSEHEIIFRTPAVRLDLPEVIAAKKNGTEFTSQIDFFLHNSPTRNIIGVTGTKGKGTTSKLIYEMLRAAGVSAYLGGNFGPDVISLLDTITEADYIVLELSSFQLNGLDISPHIGVVLMVTQDHLEYHDTAENYVEAKSSIVKYQNATDYAVINWDFPLSRKIGDASSGQKSYIQTLPQIAVDTTEPFKIYNPEDYIKIPQGIFAEQLLGNIYTVEAGRHELFMNIKDIPLRGFHMMQNVCAAIAVALLCKIKKETIIEVLLNFKGLEHRLEFVTEKNGIKFFNDSLGTTPESCIVAVEAFNEPKIIIVGGYDKKGDYEFLAKRLSQEKNLKLIITVGDIADRLEKYLKAEGYPGELRNAGLSLEEAFAFIREFAKRGDVVLLAPATSSFGMYHDYKKRGEHFKKLANEF